MPNSALPPGLRILVVDDHAIVREGVVRILGGAAADADVRQAGDGFAALEALRQAPADVVIADLSMPGLPGLEFVRRLRAEHPRAAVLVLSMHGESQYALRAFKSGANGYLTKDRATAELVDAVRKVAAGGAYVTPGVAEQMVLGLHRPVETVGHEQLSDREFDVLRRLVAGQRVGQIADELHLSIKTISSHKRRILDKLGLDSTAALIRYGLDHGLATGLPAGEA